MNKNCDAINIQKYKNHILIKLKVEYLNILTNCSVVIIIHISNMRIIAKFNFYFTMIEENQSHRKVLNKILNHFYSITSTDCFKRYPITSKLQTPNWIEQKKNNLKNL